MANLTSHHDHEGKPHLSISHRRLTYPVDRLSQAQVLLRTNRRVLKHVLGSLEPDF